MACSNQGSSTVGHCCQFRNFPAGPSPSPGQLRSQTGKTMLSEPQPVRAAPLSPELGWTPGHELVSVCVFFPFSPLEMRCAQRR